MKKARRLALLGSIVLALVFVLSRVRVGEPHAISPALRPAAGSGGATARDATSATDPAFCVPTPGGAPDATLLAREAARVRRASAMAQIRAFESWLIELRQADATRAPTLTARGRELAIERRAGLKHLIEVDPQRALTFAIPAGIRADLPAEIEEQLEHRIDARGDFDAIVACYGAETRVARTIKVGQETYRAFLYGRRENQGAKLGLPLHGIAIDDAAALWDTPYRRIEDDERARYDIPEGKFAIMVGRDVVPLGDAADFKAVTDQLLAAESIPGPRLQATIFDSGGPSDVIGHPTAAVTSPTSWIQGAKRVLWLKLEFADDPGAAATDDQILATNSEVSAFYNANSQARTTMTFTILPALLPLKHGKTYFESASGSEGTLANEAKQAAKDYDAAHGGTGQWDPDRYDRWIMVFKRVDTYPFSGAASVGGTPVWLNNNVTSGVTGHELGHNQSLDHSHAWVPASNNPIGAGSHAEYGDPFDRMGSAGSSTNNHFNTAQKWKLGYLDAAAVTNVTQSGTYRIFRHDHVNASGVRALRVSSDYVDYEYWLEHRRYGPTSLTLSETDRLNNGVLLHWGPEKLPKFVSGHGSYLLDMTPTSPGGMNDAPLRVGEIFTDPDAGITVRPLAAGGTTPNEYVDIEISFGATGNDPSNHNPVVALNAPTGTLYARTNLLFNATATDPENDPVYFRWDFGDNKLQPNLGSVSKRYLQGGAYQVKVFAYDGRGGVATANRTLDVVDPLRTWTRRAQGLFQNIIFDVIHTGTQFVAVGVGGAVFSSPEGTTWTRTGTTPTGTLRSVAFNGTRYVAVGYRSSTGTGPPIAYSDDLKNWTGATTPDDVIQLTDVAFGLGRFVAVGFSGQILTSPDGIAWTLVNTGVTDYMGSVTYADGTFVVTGHNGRIFVSNDGVNWRNRSQILSSEFAARYNGLWYTMNSRVSAYTSPDGETWTPTGVYYDTAPADLDNFNLVVAAGVLLSVGSNLTIGYVEDASTPASYRIDSASTARLWGAAEGNGTVVVVGEAGSIYTTTLPPGSVSAPVTAPALHSDADSLKVSVGRPNLLAAGGTGFERLELYANGIKVSEIAGSAGAFNWTPAKIGTYLLIVRGVTAGGASAASGTYVAEAGITRWTSRNLSPVVPTLNGAVRVGDKWWIVGQAGTLLTLDAAGTSTPVEFPTTQSLNAITYANGRFIVTANYRDLGARADIGCLWTSTDGYTWTQLINDTTGQGYNLNAVTYNGTYWIAVGASGVIIRSPDGLTWTRQSQPLSSTLASIAYGAGTWVTVSIGGKILTSPDGATWTERTSNATDLRAVTFNNGTFVAVGGGGNTIVSSSDGISWTRRTPASTTGFTSFNGVGARGGGFIAVADNGTIQTSPDGVSWSALTEEGGRLDGNLFAVTNGNDGLIVGRCGTILTSTAGGPWRRVAQGTLENRTAVLYAGGKFVAVGASSDAFSQINAPPISTSPDGRTWTRSAPNDAFVNLYGAAFARSLYVAAGDSGRIFTSPDATTWTQRTSGISTRLFSLTGSAAGFVAAGASGNLVHSIDGVTWVARTSGVTSTLRGATASPARFVVVGDGGVILTSSDGVTWARANSGVSADLLVVSWFENFGFIAGGASGTMLGSTDGVTWTPLETGVTEAIFAIAETPVGLVASTGFSGTLLLSLDGVNWSVGTMPVDRGVHGLAANSSSIVAGGDQGVLMTFDLNETLPAASFPTPPAASQSVNAGLTTTTLSAAAQNATGGVYQWFKDGTPIVGANTPVYTIPVTLPGNIGSYTVAITTAAGTSSSPPAMPAIVGVSTTSKVIGSGAEIGANIAHPNGNIFDQVLLQGSSASVTADPGQVLRISFVDTNDDIVQLEFAGAGTLSLLLDAPSGPALPMNYNQAVNYMKGHAGIVVTGADETTNLSIFSVGRGNALNPALFKDGVSYDGVADIAYVAIASRNGKFGGLRTANASYFATKGITGVYAPGVAFTGPVFIGNINAFAAATPMIILGSAGDTQINGGDLLQANGRAVAVSGLSQLKFVPGSTSHHTASDPHLLPAQNNQARFEEGGVDVTARIVVNPTP